MRTPEHVIVEKRDNWKFSVVTGKCSEDVFRGALSTYFSH